MCWLCVGLIIQVKYVVRNVNFWKNMATLGQGSFVVCYSPDVDGERNNIAILSVNQEYLFM